MWQLQRNTGVSMLTGQGDRNLCALVLQDRILASHSLQAVSSLSQPGGAKARAAARSWLQVDPIPKTSPQYKGGSLWEGGFCGFSSQESPSLEELAPHSAPEGCFSDYCDHHIFAGLSITLRALYWH